MENGSEDDFVRATTFKDMQEELQSVLEGEDKGEAHNTSSTTY